MYRRTARYQEQIKRRIRARHEGRLRAMLEREVSYPPELPDHRRRLVVEDYDTGTPTRTVFDLYRTPRIDTYRVAINGAMRTGTMGWSAVLVEVRKAKPRKCSTRWIGG